MWKSIVVLAFYHHDVISGIKYKTTITHHTVPYKNRSLTADQQSMVRFAMPLSASVIVSEVCQKWRYAGIPVWMEVSSHFREPLWEVSNHVREPLERGFYWILKTSLSPKDQRELFISFSKCI